MGRGARRACGLRVVPVVLAAMLVSGCGLSQITSGLGTGVFSSDDEKTTTGWEASITEEGLLEAARADQGGPVEMAGLSRGCPPFQVWPADRHVTMHEQGRVGDRLAVVHRGSITKTARECEIRPGSVAVKYGFAGRVLMGPRGSDGTVSLPVQVHLTDINGQKIRTENLNVNVELSRGQPVGYFSMVRTISFDLMPGIPPGNYRLFVAFDRTIPGAS
jgi:hypothetical protein